MTWTLGYALWQCCAVLCCAHIFRCLVSVGLMLFLLARQSQGGALLLVMAWWRNLVTCYNTEASDVAWFLKFLKANCCLEGWKDPSTVLEKRRLKGVCRLAGEIQNGIWLLKPHGFQKIPLSVLCSETPGIFCLKFQRHFELDCFLKTSNKASNRQQSSWKEKARRAAQLLTAWWFGIPGDCGWEMDISLL